MVLQILGDCTVTTPDGTHVLGLGELLTLPMAWALKVLTLEPEHFKIIQPTPLLPGVVVRWLTGGSRIVGTVQLIEEAGSDRHVAVQVGEDMRWIGASEIVDIDPWPAIDAQLEEAWPYLAIDGEDSPQVVAVREWLCRHFEDNQS